MTAAKLDPALCRQLAKTAMVSAEIQSFGLSALARELLGIVAAQLTAAADLAERPTLTEERVREVVSEAIAAARLTTMSVETIATRAAKELAGAVVDGAGLQAIRRRVTRLTLAAGLPSEVWSELCHLDTALSQLIAAVPLATAFDRAAVAITGQSAAALTEQLKPATASIGPADTVIIDRALQWYSRQTLELQEYDAVIRIRAAQAGALTVTAETITDEQLKELWLHGGNLISGRDLFIALGESVAGVRPSTEEVSAARERCAAAWNSRHGGAR